MFDHMRFRFLTVPLPTHYRAAMPRAHVCSYVGDLFHIWSAIQNISQRFIVRRHFGSISPSPTSATIDLVVVAQLQCHTTTPTRRPKHLRNQSHAVSQMYIVTAPLSWLPFVTRVTNLRSVLSVATQVRRAVISSQVSMIGALTSGKLSSSTHYPTTTRPILRFATCLVRFSLLLR